MATATIYGATTDGCLYKGTAGGYWLARDAVAADDLLGSANELRVGWLPNAFGQDWLYRAYLYFDTSSIPAAAEISAATLQVYLYYEDSPPGGHDIILYNGQPTYPSAVLAVGDFNRLLYAGGGASNVTVWGGASGLQTFTLNSTGFGWITKAGTTKLCLRSEFDVSPTIPGVDMLAYFYAADKGTTYRPVLTITYGVKATVTTDAATSLGPSYATGNATITDVGDGGITDYGFIWNDDGTDPVDLAHADNHVHSVNLAGGVFSASITGLSAATDYYYRAYVTNAGGTAYGSAVEFTTTAAAAVLTVKTNLPTIVADTTATLPGYIVEDAGDTVTQHGFIWKQNSDPYEEASPIHNPTGADNYVLLGTGAEGAFSTGITGLDTGSVYLVRAFAVSTGSTAYGGVCVIRTGDEYSDTFYGLTGDGDLISKGESETSYSAAYAAACAADAAITRNTSDTEIQMSRIDYKNGSIFTVKVQDAYLYFNTSSIPAGATITAATLSVYLTDEDHTGTPYIETHDGQPTYPSSSGTTPALALADFDRSDYTYVCAITFASVPPGAYLTLCTDTSIVTPGGLTKVGLQADSFADEDYVQFYSGNNGSNKPKLEVTWTTPGDAPPLPQVNVGGTMKDASNALLRVGNQWRLVTEILANVTGAGMTGIA